MDKKNAPIENKSEAQAPHGSTESEYRRESDAGQTLTNHVERNGEAVACRPGYFPLSCDLELLTKYWAKTYFYNLFRYHIGTLTGDLQYQRILRSQQRLAELQSTLGRERCSKVLARLEWEFEKRLLDDDEWLAFRDAKD